MSDERRAQLEQLQKAIAETEARLRELLPAEQLAATLAPLREQVAMLKAELEGSGAIAQGEGATAIGERGVIAHDVGGHVITGDDNRVVDGPYYEHYHEADPAQAVDIAALRQTYLGRVLQEAGRLSLAGIDRKAAGDEQSTSLNLAAVYTALLTRQVVEPDYAGGGGMLERGSHGRPVSALAQLDEHSHLVLLGDPGSGKSTFVNFVTLCLAGECLGRPDVNVQLLTIPLPDEDGEAETERQPWQHGLLLPLRVILRDLAARGLPADPQQATVADDLWQFLAGERATAGFVPYLRRELQQRGGLILLDGLDEVPAAQQRREQIKQLVADLVATLPKARILVTSRTYAYQQQEWRLEGFNEAELAPFSAGQIRRFVDRWYAHTAEQRHLDAADAQGRAELLKHAIFSNSRLHELAERPLLLTLMASLHAWRGGSLPEKREQLYADAVDLLLDWWEDQRVVRDAGGQIRVIQPSLQETLKVGRDKLRELLHRLAYEAHAAQPDPEAGTADITEAALRDGLLALSQDPDLRPGRLVEYLRDRAGLLVPHGVGVYTFPHRTFQEYLAACYLTDHDYPEQVAELVRADPNRWREVALLAGAKAAGGSASTIWSLVDALCYQEVPEAAANLAETWGAQLAAQALVETADLTDISARNQRKVARLQQWLVHIVRGAALPATERVLAAAHLARLGDPRPEVMTVDEMQFCFVPQGLFWMGSDEENQWEKDAKCSTHERAMPYDYWLARYPVTNGQFQAFVDDGGYQEEAYWPEALAHGWWREGEAAGTVWMPMKRKSKRLWCARPYNYGYPFNLSNHPAVGINWYEALAFTRWLTARWQTAGLLPVGWVVSLPSEAEWEKGARGGVEIPAQPLIQSIQTLSAAKPQGLQMQNPDPQRRSPWGNDPAGPEHANFQETGISSTSGLGCFPAGRSPYGCDEMIGNIWEWTRSLWGRYDREKSQRGKAIHDQWYHYPYDAQDGREDLMAAHLWRRVIRGGAWPADESWMRCAFRSRNAPFDRDDGIGFRVVLSAPTSGL